LALGGSTRFGAKGTGEVHAGSTPAGAAGVLTGELWVPPTAADVEQLFADAEALLLAGYEGLKKDEKAIPPQGKVFITNSLQRLVELYDDTGKKDEAARRRKELAAAKGDAKP
jgi:hypothetical protein